MLAQLQRCVNNHQAILKSHEARLAKLEAAAAGASAPLWIAQPWGEEECRDPDHFSVAELPALLPTVATPQAPAVEPVSKPELKPSPDPVLELPPMPEPGLELPPKPEPEQEPEPEEKRKAHPDPQPFLTEREWSLPEAEDSAPAQEKTFEQRFGSQWLLYAGGLLLVMGLGFAGVQIEQTMTPWMRTGAAYLISLIVAVAGGHVMRWNSIAGRTGVAIGLAAGYFTSYASGHLPRMAVWGIAPALGMMAAFAASLTLLAERWRSPLAAGIGLALAAVPALISGPVSPSAALAALSGLALAGVVLLYRNQWIELTVFHLLLIHGSFGGLAFYLWNFEGQTLSLPLWLSAIGLCAVGFSFGFGKWSASWLMREDAARRLRDEEGLTIPYDPARMPWSYGAKMFNSLALIALSVSLFAMTRQMWGAADWTQLAWLLGALALFETSQLAFRPLRRGMLSIFHSISAVVLVSGAIMAATSGLNQAILLAFQALMLSGAGMMSPSLRWLRPIAAIPATLTVQHYLGGGGAMISWPELAPPALLLAGTLPSGIFTGKNDAYRGSALIEKLELLAGNWRALLASGLYVFTVLQLNLPAQVAMPLVAIWAAGVGAGLLRGVTAWRAAFLFSLASAWTGLGFVLLVKDLAWPSLLVSLPLLVGLYAAAKSCKPLTDRQILFAALSIFGFGYTAIYALKLWGGAYSGPAAFNGEWLLHSLLTGAVLIGAAVPALKLRDGIPGFLLSALACGGAILAAGGTIVFGVSVWAPAALAIALLASAHRFPSAGLRQPAILASVLAVLGLSGLTEALPLVNATLNCALISGVGFFMGRLPYGPKLMQAMGAAALVSLVPAIAAYQGYSLGLLSLGAMIVAGIFAAPAFLHLLRWRDYLLNIGPAMIMTAIAAMMAVFQDAAVSLIPAALFTAAMLAVWAILAVYQKRDWFGVAAIAPLAVIYTAGAVFQHFVPGTNVWEITAVIPGLLAVFMAIIALGYTGQRTMLVSIGTLLAAGFAAGAVAVKGEISSLFALYTLLLGGGLAFLDHCLKGKESYMISAFAKDAPHAPFAVGIMLLLAGPIGFGISPPLFTVWCGLIGFAALAGGFLSISRVWRYTGLALFGFAAARVFLIHIADDSWTAKVIAFIGVGIVLIAAGYLYGLLARRLLEEPVARG